ncbi:MAG: GNAT family N-acetyltransferase [Betaproteobacteria bacterium]
MECIQHTAAFRALQNDWHGLHRACAHGTPFNSWAWLFSWWQANRGEKQLRLLAWRSGGALVAVAPFYVANEKTGIGTQANVLRMLGDGSGDSDYLDFLIRPDVFATVAQQIGEWLAANRSWDVLTLHDLPKGSPTPTVLRHAAERHGFLFRAEYGRCGMVELPGTFEQFLQSRQPRFRTKMRSLLKRLDGHELVFEANCPPAKLRERLRSLFALHQKRWHGAGTTGVFGEKAKRLFYAHFAPRFARSGWLRLYSLRKGDTDLAHQLCFRVNGVTYLLQEGFDASNPSGSYGQMLRAAVMRHLIGQGEHRYDFLGGFSRHKEDWGATEAKTTHVAIARHGWSGWLYFKLPVWREQSAEAAKRWLPAAAVRMLKRTRAALS